MKPFKSSLLSSTVVPAMMLAAGLLAACDTAPSSGSNPRAVAANPCAAKRNPCNPCAAKSNPCAAQRNPCNPCAAKRNPCNPCAAQTNPCNPCAAKNPCNPCAAGGGAVSAKCVVPRLQTAAANPCNPCAAKRNPCNPCNPCGARANPSNPCAAKRNPCNPCAAKNPCNPCSPSAAAEAPELTKSEAVALYNCLKGEMKAAYAKSGNRHAGAYTQWAVFNTQPYVSATHGERYVNNYANAKARNYGRYENVGKLPAGAVLAKNSFTVTKNGRAGVGPLFLMEKMSRGFNKSSHDWRYTLLMPTGAMVGTTNGRGAANVKFCIECHVSVAEDQDSLMFMPEEFRRTR